MYFRISYLNKIVKALEKEKVVTLLGARQVWKTTILMQLKEKFFPNAKYINCEKYFFGEKISTYKEFLNFLKFQLNIDLTTDWIVFFDEIQVLSNFETFLKILYDDSEIKAKIVVTGSILNVSWKVGSTMVGRWKVIKIFPFSFYEFLESKWLNVETLESVKFDWIKDYLLEYLIFGGYPKVVFAKSKQEKIEEISNIIDSYLKKDILFFFSQDEIVWFKKIFQKIVLDLWSIFSYESLATNLGISIYKVKKYLKFLENSFLIYPVYPFFTDKTKEYSKNPKIYLNDLWLINWFRWNFSSIEFSDWKLIENFVFLALNWLWFWEINFYRKKSGSEIDFIIRNLWWKIIPIEVKTRKYCKIPQVFKSFLEKYEKIIDKFIVTNLEDTKQIDFNGKKVFCVRWWDLKIW